MFTFSLEAVLKIRQRAVEQAQLDLAEEMREETRIRTDLANRIREREESRMDLLGRSTQGLSANEFLIRRLHLDGLRASVKELRAGLTEAQQRVEDRRQALIAADREKKAVERLKERAYEKYQEDQRRLEMKALDEFAVIGFARAGSD